MGPGRLSFCPTIDATTHQPDKNCTNKCILSKKKSLRACGVCTGLKTKKNHKTNVCPKTLFYITTQRQIECASQSQREQCGSNICLWVNDLYKEQAGGDYPKSFGKSRYKLRAPDVAPAPMATQWKNVERNKRRTKNGGMQHYTRCAGSRFKREQLTRKRAKAW